MALADLSAFVRQTSRGGPQERMLVAPGNPNRGRELFRSRGCPICHGRDARGDGDRYAYDPDAPEAFSGQNYFPDGMARRSFYQPVERGFEREVKKRLDYWAKLRRERAE